MALIRIYVIPNGVEHFFMGSSVVSTAPLVGCLLKPLANF